MPVNSIDRLPHESLDRSSRIHCALLYAKTSLVHSALLVNQSYLIILQINQKRMTQIHRNLMSLALERASNIAGKPCSC